MGAAFKGPPPAQEWGVCRHYGPRSTACGLPRGACVRAEFSLNKNRIIRLSWQKRVHALSLSYTHCSTRHPMSPDLREERKTRLEGNS